MKGKTMADKNNGWKQPEAKFPETELEDSFAGFFSEEEEQTEQKKNKKHRKKKSGPDILAVSEETDSGFVITEVVALDTGDEIVQIKEEPEEVLAEDDEPKTEQEEKEDEHGEEKADAHAENEEDEETIIVDLSAEGNEEPEETESVPAKKPLFAKAKRHINHRRTHKYAATVGAVLIALALIGAISLCSVLINLGARVLDNTSQKEAFEWKIYPLLMFDPATFDDPKQLDEEFLLKTALWSTLLENKTKYNYDEYGFLLVPASDLDVAAKSLYGSGITLQHKSFSEGYDYAYNYDEESKIYSVPVLGQSAGYVPEVVEIQKNGNIYTLIVGYVAPTTLWNVSEDGSAESVPDKYLYYDLEKVARGEFTVKAVRNIPADELPEDLEVSDIQFMNPTQYLDYDAIQQEAMNQELAQAEAEAADAENAENPENAEGEASPEASSEGE